MHKLFFLLALGCGQQCFAQLEDTTPKNPLEFLDTSSYWYKDHTELIRILKLKDMRQLDDSFHFRFWSEEQAIDIWSSDNKAFWGVVTTFARRYNEKLIKKNIYEIDSTFFKTELLDSVTSHRIFLMISRLKITDIPTDQKIKGWSQGLDGSEYLVEFSNKKSYSFKKYWTPYLFSDSIPEAKRIQQLIDYLFKDLRVQINFGHLNLPEGIFQTNGLRAVSVKTQQFFIYPGESQQDFLFREFGY